MFLFVFKISKSSPSLFSSSPYIYLLCSCQEGVPAYMMETMQSQHDMIQWQGMLNLPEIKRIWVHLLLVNCDHIYFKYILSCSLFAISSDMSNSESAMLLESLWQRPSWAPLYCPLVAYWFFPLPAVKGRSSLVSPLIGLGVPNPTYP